MFRAVIFVSLLTPAAVSTLDTDPNETRVLREGDTLCIGYDRDTHSCLVKQLISTADEGGITVLEQMTLSDFGTDLTLTTLSKNSRKGSRYCVVPDSIRATVVPEIHHAAPALTSATVSGLNRYAQAWFCVEHRACKDEHVAIAYAGEVRFAEEDTLYRLFSSDDPKLPDLDLRAMQIAELDEIKGFAPVSCLPKE